MRPGLLLIPLLLATSLNGLAQGGPPIITQQPHGQSVTQGMNASFSVGVSSITTLTYQWRFNGGNISGATGSSYSITNVQASQAGSYSVLVINGVGSATSTNAVLNVTVLPGFVVAWGYNGYGEATVPAGLSNVVAVAAGGYNSLALRSDGTVAAGATTRSVRVPYRWG